MMNMSAAPPMQPMMQPPPPPPPQPVDPQILFQAQETLKKPTWDDIIARLRNDRLRSFTIDIETDSTIVADEAAQQQAVSEFLSNVGTLLTAALPIVQQAPEFGPMFGEMLKFAARRFNAGRQMEAVIDETVDRLIERLSKPVQQAPDPKVMVAQIQAQAATVKGQAEVQVMQGKAQAEAELASQKAQSNMALRASEAQADQQLEFSKAQTDAEVAAFKAINQPAPKGAA